MGQSCPVLIVETKHNMTTISGEKWDQIFREMVPHIFPNVLHRALFWGVTQTGKTTTLRKLLGGEEVTFHSGMPLDDVIGGWTLRNGTTVWSDGPAIRAMRNGTPLIINELNDIPMEVKTFLYVILDKEPVATLPSGEVVRPAPGYCVVGTMNPNPSVLPEPVFERFDMVFKVDTLSDGAREALGAFAPQAERHIARQSRSLEWSRPMSVGLLMAAARLCEKGVEPDDMTKALGLTGRAATDFLAALTE